MLLGFILGVFAGALCVAIITINAQDNKLEKRINDCIKENEENINEMLDNNHIPRID